MMMEEKINDEKSSAPLEGTVEHITFHNAANGYSVFLLDTGSEKPITCVGSFPDINVGESLRLYGSYGNHSVYGKQFKVDKFESVQPEGTAAILRYLSSGMIHGVGPATARSIVERFGERALDIIENDYEQLGRIRGISVAKAKKISDSYKKQNGVREAMMELSAYGINAEEAARIYKQLGKNTVELFKSNPYLLYTDEIGFSFERICLIAERLSISGDNINRIAAGITYILKHNLMNGHTCLPKEKLLHLSKSMLGCGDDNVEKALEKLVREVAVKIVFLHDVEFVFLMKYYTAESFIAQKLRIMQTVAIRPVPYGKDTIEELQRKFKIVYESKQTEAIHTALQRGIMVLTGGPGTGKTTTLKAIIDIFENASLDVALAAPTGRAAKRMTELTGKDAKTLHRLLEVEWDENDMQSFSRNERNPLTCDVVIIDEMSMVDSLLFESLLRALPLGSRIIMVGDSDQLPSVGAGNVLGDIIESGEVPQVRLTEIFRQALSSLIITNAHDIVSGVHPQLDVRDNDMFMIDITDSAVAADYVVNLCCTRLPKAYGYNCFNNIQVLCPSKKTNVGTVALNNLLQERLNPKAEEKQEIVYKGYTLRVGDKVMQVKNNYDIEWKRTNGESGTGVFNGDIGVLSDINKAGGSVTVVFDDKTAVYATEDASQLELAYAVTVHKSQGSEFDCVIIPVLDTPEKLCYRNLLYTAVTRAKRQLILVGDRNAVYRMTDNNKKTLRYTGLKEFFKNAQY